MKCIKCRTKACVELKRHHSAYCSPHYIEFFRNQVARAIKRLHMLNHQDKILVAVSGGKDSLALWDILLETGYSASGLHIHLGIGEYSSRSAQRCRDFAKDRRAQLLEVELEESFGLGVPSLSKVIRRVPCSGCGLNKRYLFNRIALEHQFDVVATGHNLDDEAATLLGNLMHWQHDALARQSPILEGTHPKLVKKIKPLYTVTERESASYCILRNIDFVEDECPNAKGAHSLLYKDVLNRIELESPGSKQQFLQGFLDKREKHFSGAIKPQLNECTLCGQVTTSTICSFCRMWDRANTSKSPILTSQKIRTNQISFQ